MHEDYLKEMEALHHKYPGLVKVSFCKFNIIEFTVETENQNQQFWRQNMTEVLEFLEVLFPTEKF